MFSAATQTDCYFIENYHLLLYCYIIFNIITFGKSFSNFTPQRSVFHDIPQDSPQLSTTYA